MSVFKLQAYMIEKCNRTNSCAHLQMFYCVASSEGNEHYGRSYGFHLFVTEVLTDA